MTAYIIRRNFQAELPEDFRILKSIKRPDGTYLITPFTHYGSLRYIPEYFELRIHENRILFSGSFSRYWFIRIWQKLFDRLFPSTYLIEYE